MKFGWSAIVHGCAVVVLPMLVGLWGTVRHFVIHLKERRKQRPDHPASEGDT